MSSNVYWNPGPLYAKIISAHAEAVRAAGADAKRAAPRDTGKLAGSVRAVASAPGRGAIIASARYAKIVEKGARPHPIAPKARVLAGKNFGPVGGTVEHPGQDAQPFLRPAAARFPSYFRLMAAKRLMR
jgi:hypothetical protein